MYHASFIIFIIINTKQERQQEWNSIYTMARNNGFPLQIIRNLKNKLIHKTQKNRKCTHTDTKK
jgi:hypothetical protein